MTRWGADILAYMGSDWASGDARSKDRFYADLDPENLESFPGHEIIESLPPELREQVTD